MPVFTPDDVAYLRGLAEKMERGFYSVNPQWVRDLADRVEGTLALIPNAVTMIPAGMIPAVDRCPCDDKGTYPVCRAVPHFPGCPKYEQEVKPND